MAWTLEEDQSQVQVKPPQQGGKWVLEDQPKQPSEYGRVAQEALGIAKGVSDPFVGASQLIMRGLHGMNLISDEALKAHEDYYNNLENKYQTATPEGSGVGRVIGNVVSGAPLAITPAAGAGLAARVGMGMATGAANAALQPVMTDQGQNYAEEKAKQVGLGLLAGGAAPAIGSAISRAVNPKTAQALQALENGAPITPQTEAELGHSLNVAKVIKEGGTVTPGQALGGVFKRMEEAATSVPITGDVIKSAQTKGIENFNRSVVNRALAPIGQKIASDEPVGYKLIDKAHQAVSQNYDDLLSKMNPLRVDPQFDNQMSNLMQMSSSLHPDYAQQFNGILENEVFRKFTPAQTMSATSMKEIESSLGKLARKFGRSEDGNQQQLSDALQEAQRIVRETVERQNPQYAGEMQKANLAWAELLRVENAAGRMGAKGGIFTPGQYEGATRQMDQSLRKGQFSRGQALGQDYATAAESVLANKLPDSGTPARLMAAGGAIGTLGAGAISPMIPIAAIAGAAAYSAPAQKALQALMTQRPDLAPEIARHLKLISQSGGLLAAPAIAGNSKQ